MDRRSGRKVEIRMETNQMKLTKQALKRIIKEELEAVIEENSSQVKISEDEAKKAQKVAEQSKDSPAMQTIFDQLESNPEFMKAMEQAKEQMKSMSEERTAGMMTVGTMVGFASAWKILYTSAGVAAVAAAGPVIGVTAATAVAIGGAFMAPVVIGFMIDRMIDIESGNVRPPKWAQSSKGESK